MNPRFRTLLGSSRLGLRQFVIGPQALALLPVVILSAYWLGGEPLLIVCALALPLCLACFAFSSKRQLRVAIGRDDRDAPPGAAQLEEVLETILRQSHNKALKSACLLMCIDDYDEITSRYGQSAALCVAQTTVDRLRTALRSRDKVFAMEDGSFAVALAPVRQLDLDIALTMTARLQSSVEEPVTLDATTIYVSASAGFCLSSQLTDRSGKALATAAELALIEARRNAPSAIRAYAPGMRGLTTAPGIGSCEVVKALENGQIRPWFQPQVSTDSGQVTGFEALARWMHPERGLISPAEFLPLLEAEGKMERLGEVMMFHALNALSAWDMQGLQVPNVGVNFSPDELRNPHLLDKVEWELNRFNLTPDRLVVEILETVVATSPDDMVTRNINGLSALGCPIDLDDFGTGHASISSIRRFAIGRLKIDRSFVMKVDQDIEQQRMVSAILLMAERLDLDTLAEGVETAGEHSMLAQLGCGHVQGFGLARPMPFEKTSGWVADYTAKLDDTRLIGRKYG